MLSDPIALLALLLSALVSIVALILALLALRRKTFFKMSLRNMVRRRSQTVLIIIGLMLSTILITSSLGIGDSVKDSFRGEQLAYVGNLDEGVSIQPSDGRTELPYFGEQDAQRVETAIRNTPHVAAVIGSLVTPEKAVAAYDTKTRSISAENLLLGVPPDFSTVWGTLHSIDGHVVQVSDLQPGEVYLGKNLASALNAHPGDTVQLFIEQKPSLFSVRAILDRDIDPANSGGTSSSIIMPLARLQELVGQPGGVNIFYIKNQGQGGLDDLGPNNSTSHAIARALRAQFPSYTVATFKQNIVDTSVTVGAAISLAMTAVSLFLIIAGMLLIYLIFIVLAAERRAELGMSRAIGMKRRHLIQLFVFEGMLYTFCSTLVGIPLGIGATALLVSFINGKPLSHFLLGTLSLHVNITWPSLLFSFSLSIFLAFFAVAFSSYKMSRMNIVTAIRNLDDTQRVSLSVGQYLRAIVQPFGNGARLLRRGHPFRSLVSVTFLPLKALWNLLVALCERGPLTLLLAVLLLFFGVRGHVALFYSLGASLLMLGIGLTVRWLLALITGNVPLANRVGFSLLGIGLLFYWTEPFGPFEKLIGLYDKFKLVQFQSGFTVFCVSTIFTIAGAIWLIMYNGDLLIKSLMFVLSRFRRLAPVARTSMAYSLSYKTRNGLMVAMFALVVFITVLSVTLSGAVDQNNQIDRWTGGWQVQTDSPGLPSDLSTQIQADPKLSHEITSISWMDTQLSSAKQIIPGQSTSSSGLLLRAADNSFLTDTRTTLQWRARGYTTDRQVWDAVRDQTGLAVVVNNPFAPLVGIDQGFQPFEMQVQDLETPGAKYYIKVIGVLPTLTQWPGVFISTKTAADVFTQKTIAPTWYVFRVKPGVSPDQVQLDLDQIFGAKYALEAELLRPDDTTAITGNLANFLAGYLVLGLLIGISALGVVCSRSVIERRQQIGMLRALGYRRKQVQHLFLIENGFIAIMGLLIGTLLGIWSAYQYANIIIPGRDIANDSAHLPFTWIGFILLGTCLAALLMTYLPARGAARLRPSEALRYE